MEAKVSTSFVSNGNPHSELHGDIFSVRNFDFLPHTATHMALSRVEGNFTFWLHF